MFHQICLNADPLSAYPSASQLSLLQVDRWYELGARFRITEDQLEEVKKSSHPTTAILIAAKVKNIDIKWYQIVEALIHIGMYKLAKIICEKQGPLNTHMVIMIIHT